jgi:YD repeat-containing protein
MVDPLGGETRYRYTSEDQLSSVTDPGATVTEFARDLE